MPAIILLMMALVISLPLHATTNYCTNNTSRHFISVKVGSLEQAKLETTMPAQVEITTRELNSAWVFNRKKKQTRSVGFNFQYTIVDLESIDTKTNGHLHTWNFPLEGRLSKADSELFYNITPALSVSSNALKNPGLIDSDALQLYAGLIFKKSFSPGYDWFLGLNSDHRFGSYKTYPVVGICLSPASDWVLQLALPDFSILKTFNHGLSLKLFVKPVGNQWHVFSKDLTQESDFIYNATAIGLSAQWHISTSVVMSLDIENQTNRQLSFVLEDNTFINTKAESSMGLILKGEVIF